MGNRLPQAGLSAYHPYFDYVWHDVTTKIMLIGHIHTNAGLDNDGIGFFSLTSRGLPFMEVMAGFKYTIEEMNIVRTVAYLNEMVLGWGSVLVWAGIAHGFCAYLIIIKGNLNAQCYRDEILARHVIPQFQNNANITLFQHDNATSHKARDTVFPQGE